MYISLLHHKFKCMEILVIVPRVSLKIIYILGNIFLLQTSLINKLSTLHLPSNCGIVLYLSFNTVLVSVFVYSKPMPVEINRRRLCEWEHATTAPGSMVQVETRSCVPMAAASRPRSYQDRSTMEIGIKA